MKRTPRRGRLCSLLVFLAIAVAASPAGAVDYRKKTERPGATYGLTPQSPASASAARNLQAFYSESGPLHLCVDAIGTVLSFGTVEVEKPADAVVKRAFLIAATGGYGGDEIRDGEISVEGRRVMWDRSIPNVIGGWNALAEVTELLRQKMDTALPGVVVVEISEQSSEFVDGVVLAVVFELADKTVDNDVGLFFGAHGASANGFTIDMSKPVPSDISTARFEMGVGISFSMQTSKENEQYTVIDVNGRRLTAAAGGPDDGSPLAGALVTVGGVADNPANPTNATMTPENLTSDDEYYDLTPFVKPGDTQIEISTANPSKNDNLFFASFVARRGLAPSPTAAVAPVQFGGVAVPNQPVDQVQLTSSTAKGAVGSEGEVTATVLSSGLPLAGVEVRLRIVSGPHAGATSTSRTDESGRASFLYRGVSPGTDLMVAVVDEGGSAVAGSNVILYEWVEQMHAAIDIEPGVCPSTYDPRMQDLITVALLGSEHFKVSDVDEASLYLENAVPVRVQYQDISQPGDGVDCPCSSDGRDGYEDIVMLFRIQDLFVDVSGLSGTDTQKLTLTGSLKTGAGFEATNCVVVSSSTSTTTVPDNILVPTEEGFDIDG